MSENAFPQDPVYRIPQGLRVYAVGDVHGHAALLDSLNARIAADLDESPPQAAHVVYLGDYIDRGPDSRGVIDRLIALSRRDDGIKRSFLMGNHELGLFEFLEEPETEIWTQWGGLETLASYGLTFPDSVLLPAEKARAVEALRKAMPAGHLDFLKALRPCISIGDYLCAHAGIDPRKTLAQQTMADYTFIREPFLNWHRDPAYKPLPFKVVHGHTIYPEPENLPHRISVDTGAYKGGPLTCAVLEDDRVRFLQVRA